MESNLKSLPGNEWSSHFSPEPVQYVLNILISLWILRTTIIRLYYGYGTCFHNTIGYSTDSFFKYLRVDFGLNGTNLAPAQKLKYVLNERPNL